MSKHRRSRRARAAARLAIAVALALTAVWGVACASSTSTPSSTPTQTDAATTCDGNCTTDDSSSPEPAACDGNCLEDSGRPLAPEPDAARRRGVTYDGGENACGVCDRDWVCNTMRQPWRSEDDGGRCVNQKNRTGLRCDGILDGPTAPSAGTWSGSDDALTLVFKGLTAGETHEVYCIPPPL